jgi:phenylpropionate dioxygenase-like ring-hydroxylating dioxygenase large terminal subunit
VTFSVGNVHGEFRRFWHPVAWSQEVSGTPLAVVLLGEPLVLIRESNGCANAFFDECPHRGAPLSLGRFEGDELVCAFHGWRFGVDGGATCIPALGPDAAIPSRACLTKPAGVCERYGIVWVALEPAEVPVVDWSDGDDDRLGEFRAVAHTSQLLAAYQTDNLLDASHFPFLHASLRGRNPLIGEHEVVDQHRFGFSSFLRKLADDDVSTEGWLRYTYLAPFTVLLRSEEPDGGLRQSFLQAIQPIDHQHTRMFFITRVPQTDPAFLADLWAQEEIVQQEDLWMTAALRRDAMPLVGGPDLHVRSDSNAILYRRVMRNVFSPAGQSPSE